MTRPQAVHFRAIRSLAHEVTRARDLVAAAAIIERYCLTLLEARVSLVRHALSAPEVPAPVAAAHGDVRLGPPPASSGAVHSRLPRSAATATAPASPTPHSGGQQLVPLGEHAGEVWNLVLEGHWASRRERAFVAALSDALTTALQAPALRDRLERTEDVVAAAFAFSRGLTKIHDAIALRQFIVDTMAGVTHARLGALALVDTGENVLRIVATHGYPAILVEHVRLGPGQGILGRVLESRRPMLVRDIRDMPGLQQRPRYRTASFLVVPLLANSEVLGVVAFADRTDDRPFEERDLTAARALAAPAALALQNDRLMHQTRELAHAATVDPLTGLFNRRHFENRIDEEIERARRQSLELALLLIDVDDFKRINDTFGHLAGDYVLKQVAEVLKRSVRVFDVCTRYGGEEFAILMPGSSAGNALVVAERIRSRVESASRDEGPLPPYIRTTVSLGLAVLGDETSPTELIARADRALYRAKAEGKNRVSVE